MPWCKIEISADQAASAEHMTIQDYFEKTFMTIRNLDLAMFSSGWTNKNFNIYFSPACSENAVMKTVLDNFRAVVCDEPTRETERELALSVGDQNRWGSHIWSNR